MFKKSLFLISFFFSCICFSQEDKLTIDLHQIVSKIPFEDFYSEFHLRTFERFPKFKKYIVENYKGIPENDSLSYYFLLYPEGAFLFDLYKSGDIPKKDFLEISSEIQLDTLYISKIKLDRPIERPVFYIVGFKNNKQFIIADANTNADFSDDYKYEFDIDFRNNPHKDRNFINNLPISEYKYQINDSIIRVHTRKFILYPDKFGTWSLDNGKRERNFSSMFRYMDIWKGRHTINKQDTEFYFQGITNKSGVIIVKPKQINFSTKDGVSNIQFLHQLTDTIIIAGGRYVVDSINKNISKLYIKKIGVKKNNYGFAIGNYVKNINFKNLNEKTFATNNIIGKKKYTLIEFWGTWCGPCIKMAPKIKKASIIHSSKLNIISVAVDDNKDAVKKHILKNNMNWYNAYLPQKGNMKTPIYKQLNIIYFPTFILLDSKGKIIYRGSTESFNDILKMIK